MADTRVQREVEGWLRREWLRREFNQPFDSRELRLTPGGVCEFDAVSADERIVVMISTGAATTASGNGAAGKLNKLRSDILFLTMLPGELRRIVLLTARSMFDALNGERARGRLPIGIETLHAQGLPQDLELRLQQSQRVASREVSGRPGPEVV